MRRFSSWLFSCVVLLPAVLHAQKRTVELGTDAQFFHRSVTYESGGQTSHASATQLQLPMGLRAGFFISPRASVEVNMTLLYVDPSDGDSFRSLGLAVGPMIHFSPDITRAQPYVRPYLGVNHNSAGNGSSRLFFGGALGIKVPMTTHGAMRYELMLQHGEQNDNYPRETIFGLAAGFSVFFP